MKTSAYALMLVALMTTTALADSNGMLGGVLNTETVVLGGPFDHGAAAGDASNSTTTAAFAGTGGWNATEVTIEGDITGVIAFNGNFFYGEGDIVLTDPGVGATTTWQNPAGTVADDGAGSVTAYSATLQFAAPTAAAGSWGLEFIDTFDDGAGADSISNNVSMTLSEVEADVDTTGNWAMSPNTLNAIGDSATNEGEFLLQDIFDTYTFTTTITAGINAETFFQDVLEGSTLDTELGLFDSSGVMVAYNDDGGAGAYSLIGGGGPMFAADTYTLVVSGFGSNMSTAGVGSLLLADVTGGNSTLDIFGDYGISVVLTVPEPAAASFLVMVGLIGFTRRRRR